MIEEREQEYQKSCTFQPKINYKSHYGFGETNTQITDEFLTRQQIFEKIYKKKLQVKQNYAFLTRENGECTFQPLPRRTVPPSFKQLQVQEVLHETITMISDTEGDEIVKVQATMTRNASAKPVRHAGVVLKEGRDKDTYHQNLFKNVDEMIKINHDTKKKKYTNQLANIIMDSTLEKIINEENDENRDNKSIPSPYDVRYYKKMINASLPSKLNERYQTSRRLKTIEVHTNDNESIQLEKDKSCSADRHPVETLNIIDDEISLRKLRKARRSDTNFTKRKVEEKKMAPHEYNRYIASRGNAIHDKSRKVVQRVRDVIVLT